MKLLALVSMLLVGALLAVGCGDDSSSDEPAPTKAAYIAEADDLCIASDDQLEVIVQDLPDSFEAPETQAAITDEIIPLYRDLIEDLRALTPPEGDEEATAAVYDALEQVIDEIEEDPSVADSGDAFDSPNALAEDYGFEICGD